MKQVGVIGGSGFIGSYNTKKFLEEGYKVRVSTTDLSNNSKYDHLFDLPHSENLEMMQMNVLNKEEVDFFIKGCEIIIHGGTPFQLQFNNPETELLNPTITGTINVLDAVKNNSKVKKLVFVASVAALNTNFPLLPSNKNPGDTISEDDESFMSVESHPYAIAKYKANQYVEKYIEENPSLSFEIISICPVLVIGKPLSQRQDSMSMGILHLFKDKIAPDEMFQMIYDNNVPFAMVHVADVAEAIFKSATVGHLHGYKFITSSESFGVNDISLILNDQPPVGNPFEVYLNHKARHKLGIHFKSATESLNSYSKLSAEKV